MNRFAVGVIQGRQELPQHEHQRGDRQPCTSILGYRFGDYSPPPIGDVNRRSTNDVYPTAIKLAMVFGVKRLLEEHRLLHQAFARKVEFAGVLKVGRTQMQDAVPTLGQEFNGFAHTLAEDCRQKSSRGSAEINMRPRPSAPESPLTRATQRGGSPPPRCDHRDTHGNRRRPHRGGHL
jgi:hypothetical protein